MTMHSTERAALRLALGLLRRFVHLSPRTRPAAAAENDLDAAAMVLAIDEAPPTGAGDMPAIVALGNALIATEAMAVPPRILRARLALYLRAVLRAEAGDRGLWWVGQRKAWPYFFPVEWRSERVPPAATRKTAHGWKAQPGDTYRLAVPLWSQAPGRAT